MNIEKRIVELTDFQTCFNSTYNTQPVFLDYDTIDLRIELFNEEANELLLNLRLKDKTEILDAIGDCTFLLFGDIVSFGLQDYFKDERVIEEIKNVKEQTFTGMYLDQVTNFNELKYSLSLITYELLGDTISLFGINKFYSKFGVENEEMVTEYINGMLTIFIKRIALLDAISEALLGENYEEIIDQISTVVYESNMSKLDENKKPIINGENGILDSTRPIGKILKSDKFFTPTSKLTEIANEHFNKW